MLNIDQPGATQAVDEQTWIDVIRKMDAIYADLVHYQVELERKNADLENTQRFIRSVLASISDVLIVCDLNGRIQQVNPALEQAIGAAEEDLLGQPLKTLFTPEFHPRIDNFPDHIRTDDALIDCEVSLQHVNGDPIPLAVNCSVRHDHRNRPSGFVITGRPLGELQRAYRELAQAHESLKATQQQLVQSEKMASLGRLVAGVAHELNNPISFLYANMFALDDYEQRLTRYLTAIHNGAGREEREALRRELDIDALMKDMGSLVGGSREGAERVSAIVQNLRRFSTPQDQKPSEFDLAALARQAVSWVLKASNIKPRIHYDMPETFPIINNEGHIHQILINLIQNALDAFQEQENQREPQLLIRLREDDQIHIDIADNGPGIREADLPRLFDPFFTTKPVGSGTGLGLYISYGLATEQCGGALTVRNRRQGGACFTLSLPGEREK
ncbi:MAG TPA: PAS domain S-box protein [Gammaproteobacteria bacterium]|nr:PAS domain S-box protein [Gammaproteobacteria bacterium]